MKPGRQKQLLRILQLTEGEGMTVRAACRQAGIHSATYYRNRKALENDTMRQDCDTMRQDCDTGTEAPDTQAERQTDLKGLQDKEWTPDEIHDKLIQLVDAKSRLMRGMDSLTQDRGLARDSPSFLKTREDLREDLGEQIVRLQGWLRRPGIPIKLKAKLGNSMGFLARSCNDMIRDGDIEHLTGRIEALEKALGLTREEVTIHVEP